MTRLNPYPEQVEIINSVVNEPTNAALIAAPLGSGKTLVSVEIVRALGLSTVLVLCPLNTRIGWERVVRNQELGLPTKRIESKNSNFEALLAGEPGVYLVGWEYFRRLNWLKAKPDMVILDESHKAQSRKSLTWKTLKQLRPKYRLALSATPSGNKFEGLYTTTTWLWPKHDPLPFWKWVAKWAKSEYNPYGQMPKIVGERNPGAFVASLPCYHRPEPRPSEGVVERRVVVEMTPKMRKQYNQMEKDAITWLTDNDAIVADLPVSKRVRLRQMALGTVTLSEDDEVSYAPDCESPKITALQEIIEETDGPVLVFTHSRKFAEVVAARVGDSAALWTGKTPHATREKYIETFGTPGGPQVLVAVIEALAEGVDGLQHRCHTEVWLSESDNGVANRQAEGRLHRTGQPYPVQRYKIVSDDTIDEGVMTGLIRQRFEMEEILNG